jgi:hypothetical protein
MKIFIIPILNMWRQLAVGMLDLIPLPPNMAVIGHGSLPSNLAATGSRFCTQIVKTLNPQLVTTTPLTNTQLPKIQKLQKTNMHHQQILLQLKH